MNIEELDIPNIKGLLSEEEKEAMSLLMNKIIQGGCPVKASEIIDAELLQKLVAKHVIVQGEDGFVTVVYPVSALPTLHKVKLKDGRSFFSICAVDSLGSAFVFQQDITVSSSCSHCRKPVSITIENGEISTSEPDDICVTHTDLVGEVNWAGTC